MAGGSCREKRSPTTGQVQWGFEDSEGSMAQKKIKLEIIRIDGGTQPRAALNEAAVAEYVEAIDHLPPVTVFFDGSDNWLADGFHRYHAHRTAGRDSLVANVINGTKRDAVLYSAGANHSHGLRRSNEDKRRAVTTLLQDSEWGSWSDNKVAECCAVSQPFVSSVRRSLITVISEEPVGRTYTTKHGTQGTMKVGAIGKASSASKRVEKSEPPAKPALAVVPPPADDHDGPDLAELVDELQAENTRLLALLAVAEADDLVAEATKWRSCYDNAVRQQSEAMDRVRGAEKREAWNKKQLMRCGKAVGEDDPTKIAATVEALARQRRAA